MQRPFWNILALAGALAPAALAQISTSIVAGGGPPNGAAATNIALSGVFGVAVDVSGNLYVASSFQNRVYQVATNGTVTIMAGDGSRGYSGDGGAAGSAQLGGPNGVAVDGAGN